MNLGRRASVTDAPVDEPVAVEPQQAGKGRPTPKRADARKTRRTTTPTNRKEAAKLSRERSREQRMLARKALISGDERHLPPRDAGPEKRLARDIVDSHRTLGQYMMGLVLLALALSLVNISAVKIAADIVALVFVTLMAIDAQRRGRQAKVAVIEKFGTSPAEVRGIASYAFMRSMLPRRFRKPPPKVGIGGATL